MFAIKFKFFNNLPHGLSEAFEALPGGNQIVLAVVDPPPLGGAGGRVGDRREADTLDAQQGRRQLLGHRARPRDKRPALLRELDVRGCFEVGKGPHAVPTIH